MGNLTIDASKFSNNFASYGGALYLLNSQVNSMILITSSNFSDNNSTNSGGAIYFSQMGNLTIYLSHFRNNFGGALNLFNSQSNSMLTITDCIFRENNSPNISASLYMENYGNTLIQKNNFSNNFAVSGGAIYSLNQSNIILFLINKIILYFFESL